MKALFLAFVAACCILGSASLNPSQAQTADWFSFQVCNKSGIRNVSVAITSKNDINGQNWKVAGWWNIPDGGCYTVGGFWRDRIFIFAQGDGGAYWGGSDTTQCINLAKKFERVFTGNYTCAPDETALGMAAVIVQANVGTYTMNLQ